MDYARAQKKLSVVHKMEEEILMTQERDGKLKRSRKISYAMR
jgi:hypothetical protein